MPSTVIAHINYDPQTEILRIVFRSGSIYDYLSVPQEVYNAMKAAFSKGTFLNEEIKRKYRFKKIK